MIWLSLLGKPNYLLYTELSKAYGRPEAIYNALQENGFPAEYRSRDAFRKAQDPATLEKAKRILDESNRCGIRIVTLHDDIYPFKLSNLPAAVPLVLYGYGRFPAETESGEGPSIAIVGSRNCSAAGRMNAHTYAKVLARWGVTVVSGLARGCDGAAHRGALDGNGYTVGVLASGVDVIYPPEHRSLAAEIIDKGGLILSESPPGTEPVKQLFPARNRIIAGLTDGTLVVEAAIRSGALITSERALEADRNVFALPGNVNDPLAAGCNELIRNGAICASTPWVILEELGIDTGDKKRVKRILPPGWIKGLPPVQSAVAGCVYNGTSTFSAICDKTEFSTGDVAGALTLLEIRGLVRRDERDQYYIAV